MEKLLFALYVASVAWFPLEAAESVSDASHIDVYVTPYYNSKGPSVAVGRFSSGLASAKEDEFLATITRMKKDWDQLTFPELYVAAIRLYDLGYRKGSGVLVLHRSVSRSAVWNSSRSEQDGQHR